MLRNPAFTHNQEMQQICSGLFRRLSLNAFSFSRIYRDGSRAELWSDAEALDHSFFVKKHIDRVYTANLFNNQRFALYDLAIEDFPKSVKDRISNQLKDQRDYFDHSNCMFIIEYEKEHTEYYAFYSSQNNYTAVNDYLNYRDVLERFVRYFRKRAKRLIDDADNDRLIKPWISSFSCAEPEMKMKSPFVQSKDSNLILTAREIEIADLLCEGFTAKEAAGALSISYKTVEKHHENIRKKFGINKKSKLVSYLHSQGYGKK